MRQNELQQLVEVVAREGFDPAGQLTGYLQTGDPTYLPPGQARRMAAGLAHEELLRHVVEVFLQNKQPR